MAITNSNEIKNPTKPLTPWARPQGGHGSLRGADSPSSSPQFEGLFGRMFRTLPAAPFEDNDLKLLANAMTADPEIVTKPDGTPKQDDKGRLIPKATPETELDDEENLGIPAGYTYFGQFIDHDITFDPASSLQRQNDPEALVDFRTPRLDLDNLYGRGPADQPYMYASDGVRFLLGSDLTRNATPTKAKDLPRIGHRAIIGDKRNDENVIVSQLQGVFLQFHNAVADRLPQKTIKFEDVQRLVRWHYQWVVLHDFLPKIVGEQSLHQVLPHLKNKTSIYKDKPDLRFFQWKNDPFMPIEFAAAAYRFGHSMVRPIYRLNKELVGDEEQKTRGVDGRQFIFGALREQSLNGFRDFPSIWAIDWRLFFEFDRKLDDHKNLGPGRVQPSYKIDSSLVNPLAFLPEFSVPDDAGNKGDFQMDNDGHPKTQENQIAKLAQRNLLRGKAMGLPSGQTVARKMDIEPIPDADLRVGKSNMDGLKDNKSIADLAGRFEDNAPLWFYVLAEAQHEWAKAAKCKKGDDNAKNSIHVKLGPMGGRIVTEVLVGLILGDQFSFLSQWPEWSPLMKQPSNFAPFTSDLKGKFGISDLITVAGLAQDGIQS